MTITGYYSSRYCQAVSAPKKKYVYIYILGIVNILIFTSDSMVDYRTIFEKLKSD